jgi:hypothetical protein
MFIESVVYMWRDQIFSGLNLLLHYSIYLLISLNHFKVFLVTYIISLSIAPLFEAFHAVHILTLASASPDIA